MDDSYVYSNPSSSSSTSRPARNTNAHGHAYKVFSLRKGKWTAEEEAYSNKIILLFNKGLLPIAAGTTLRSFLSDKLQCDPMRITKKYSGASCIGKQIFQAMRSHEDELNRLEKEFHIRLGNKFRFPPSSARVNNTNNNTSDKAPASDDDDLPKSKRIRDSLFKKTSSMPDLQYGREESFMKASISSASKKKRLRAQSSIDFVKEFGIYDDNDAGELLMQFADTIKRASSSHEHMDRLYFDEPFSEGHTSREEITGRMDFMGGGGDSYRGDGECESPNVGLTMDDSDSSGVNNQTPPTKIEIKNENIHTDSSIAVTMDGLAINNNEDDEGDESDNDVVSTDGQEDIIK